jgi:hypothetical protein
MRTKTHLPIRNKPALAALIALTLAGSGHALAAPLGITSYSDYQTAIAGLGSETVQGFDGTAANTTLADGDSLGAVTFSAFDLGGADLQVADRQDQTTSNNNALESSFGAFVGLDGFTLTLDQPVTALGLFAITGDILSNGDLTLTIDQGSVALAVADVITGQALVNDFDFTDGSGTNLYFLGLVADTPFSSATLSSVDAAYSFSLDDLRWSLPKADAPLPPTALLLLAGLPLLRRRAG